MKLKLICRSITLTVTLLLSVGLAAAADQLESPDGNYRFSIDLGNDQLTYQIDYRGQPVVKKSRLGFQFAESVGNPVDGEKLVASKPSSSDETWTPVYGERSSVRDHYRAQTFSYAETGELKISVEVRCYNEGVAFCYRFTPLDPKREYEISSELTEFSFTDDLTTWVSEIAQGEYTKTTISQMSTVYERPQIFLNPDSELYVAVGEARLVDFARMKLTGSADKPNTISSELSSDVTFSGEFESPWRFVMAASSPGELLENNDLILNLSDPCAIEDTSWIKPGKVLREVTLTNEGAFACIDYAAKNGIEYMLFDAGWYGDEYDNASDATTVTIDRKRSSGEIDMEKVVKYGKEHGVGIILYVNRRSLEKQLDEILPLFKKWGIAGVKYGFVNVGSQEWTTWLHEAVRKAADHQLMIDIHDEYRPTGYSRTYPNLMTQEGIAGDETSPSPQKTLGLYFPRMLAGAADNTVCYYDGRVKRLMNHSYQLGKTVCIYSPWQFVFWYDRPAGSPGKVGGAGGAANVIGSEPELDFFAQVPTVWDDTKVLAGSIDQYAVVARRSGDDWYIGAMNAEQPNRFDIKLDFLEPGQQYNLRSYTHDESVQTTTHVKIVDETVNAGQGLTIDLKSNDGAAYLISPTKE